MIKIINLTQHVATERQIAEGVIEPIVADKNMIRELLNFEEIDDIKTMSDRAIVLATVAKNYGADCAMIGCALYFVEPLVLALRGHNIKPVYSFSKRISQEKNVDGKVVKTSTFEHQGFVGYE